MTKKVSPGDVVVVVIIGVVSVVVLVLFVPFDEAAVLVVVFPFDGAADAEPATNTASVAPSENITSVIAMTAAVLRRGAGVLTAYVPCRSPVRPGSQSLPGAGRGGLRRHCGLPAPPGPGSSPEGRRREEAARRCRRREAPSRPPRPPRPRPGSCP